MFLEPAKVVDQWDIRPGMKVADFGCGAGHYTIEIAKRVGKDGLVYAFDVQPEVLSALKGQVSVNHLSNVDLRRVDLEAEKGSQLSDAAMDFVVLSNVLFQAENKSAVAREAFRVLKPGGLIAFIDWSDSPLGPPKEQRISKEAAKELFDKLGFVLVKEFDAQQFHYGLLFRKP